MVIKVINKGYTLTVTSWEDDIDNYQTNTVTVGSPYKAQSLYDLMQLCTSKNNFEKLIRLGNTGKSGFNEKQLDVLEDFFKNNPVLLKTPLSSKKSMDEEDWKDYLTGLFHDAVNGLLGSSEFYTCRVMDKCVVTYSPNDVYLEEIDFDELRSKTKLYD